MKACKRARAGGWSDASPPSSPQRRAAPRAPSPRPATATRARRIAPRVSPSRCGERETNERAPQAAHPRRHGALDVNCGLLDINHLRLRLRAGDVAGDVVAVAGDILNGLHGGGGHSCCGCVRICATFLPLQHFSHHSRPMTTKAHERLCTPLRAHSLTLPARHGRRFEARSSRGGFGAFVAGRAAARGRWLERIQRALSPLLLLCVLLIFCSAPCSSTPPLSRAFCHPIRRCGFHLSPLPP
jgi:hypothetical protein